MNILVTGGAGYIGAVLVPMLLRANRGLDSVTVLDNFAHGQNSLAALCDLPGFDVVNGDARDMRVVEPLVAKADLVIPLAAIVGARACDRDRGAATTTNYHAVANLCGLLSPSQRVVIPTTNSGYGIGGAAECTEESQLNPISLYGVTKVQAEMCVLDRGNGVSLRLATVFGASPRMRLDLLFNDFVHRAVTDKAIVVFEGHFRRNFIHVSDVARAFCHTIARLDQMKGQAYNAGDTAANLTKLQLCAKIQEHVPDFVYLESPIGEDPDKRDYIVSNAKLEATGWGPCVTLDRGIIELLKLYRMLKTTVHGNA